MARRSPTNPRYQKDSGGKTRKSAAAAKPSRERRTPPKATTTKGVGGAIMHPPTEEYRRWRRIWWILLIVSIVLILGYWATLTDWVTQVVAEPGMIGAVLMGLAYGALFSAIFIDWTILRRIRKEYVASGQADKDAKQQPDESTTTDDESTDKS